MIKGLYENITKVLYALFSYSLTHSLLYMYK